MIMSRLVPGTRGKQPQADIAELTGLYTGYPHAQLFNVMAGGFDACSPQVFNLDQAATNGMWITLIEP